MIVAPVAVDLNDPVERDVALRVAIAWRELRRGASAQRLRDYLVGTGDSALDQGQMDTLDVLATRPSWRMGDLAEALRVDPSTATRAVARLVDIGLAERTASGEDARVVIVTATRAGRRRHKVVMARRIEVMSRILGAYSAEERVVLADLVERFVTQIDELVAELARD